MSPSSQFLTASLLKSSVNSPSADMEPQKSGSEETLGTSKGGRPPVYKGKPEDYLATFEKPNPWPFGSDSPDGDLVDYPLVAWEHDPDVEKIKKYVPHVNRCIAIQSDLRFGQPQTIKALKQAAKDIWKRKVKPKANQTKAELFGGEALKLRTMFHHILVGSTARASICFWLTFEFKLIMLIVAAASCRDIQL